jgi:hypothetical protein
MEGSPAPEAAARAEAAASEAATAAAMAAVTAERARRGAVRGPVAAARGAVLAAIGVGIRRRLPWTTRRLGQCHNVVVCDAGTADACWYQASAVLQEY